MAFRLLLLTLIFSINAYAKPTDRIQNQNFENKNLEMDAKSVEERSNKKLTTNPWQISRVFEISTFSFNPDRWYFNFDGNGRYRAYGACNYISGVYKTDIIGAFKISTLDSTNNNCDDTKDEEVNFFNVLLMADAFEIKESKLTLKSASRPLIEFQSSEKNVSFTVVHKIHRPQKNTKSNASRRTKAPKVQEGKGKLAIKRAPKKPSKSINELQDSTKHL